MKASDSSNVHISRGHLAGD